MRCTREAQGTLSCDVTTYRVLRLIRTEHRRLAGISKVYRSQLTRGRRSGSIPALTLSDGRLYDTLAGEPEDVTRALNKLQYLQSGPETREEATLQTVATALLVQGAIMLTLGLLVIVDEPWTMEARLKGRR